MIKETLVASLVVFGGGTLGIGLAQALTAAEKFSVQISTATTTRPTAFKIPALGDVAWVNPDGNMQLTAVYLTPTQAKDLRIWIKANFIDEVAP